MMTMKHLQTRTIIRDTAFDRVTVNGRPDGGDGVSRQATLRLGLRGSVPGSLRRHREGWGWGMSNPVYKVVHASAESSMVTKDGTVIAAFYGPDALAHATRFADEAAGRREFDIQKAVEAEQVRWQQAIDKIVLEYDPERDGSGIDSGDPLDLTLCEIQGAFGRLTERFTIRPRREWHEEDGTVLWWTDDVCDSHEEPILSCPNSSNFDPERGWWSALPDFGPMVSKQGGGT